MKILVLGSGAREHAIITSLLSERIRHEITAAPGNAGIAMDVATVALNADDPVAVINFALASNTELVVIGPEAPLVAGVADALRSHGIPVFGPGRASAQLEGSKAFAKYIMEKAGVPTGASVRAASLLEVQDALDAFGAPYVVKADGLAGGKGVLVTADRDEAIEHATHWLEYGSVLVEEFLDGPEVSLFLLSDGRSVVPLAPAQDFKRLGDGDTGPNTGGMGAYSPLPWLPDGFVDEVVEKIALPTVRQLAAEQTPFIGLLYCGLIITPTGTRVIEFNARFGDPETQVVLPRLVTPLSGLLLAAAAGDLADQPRPEFALDVAVAVVLASEGYPAAPVTGRRLGGLDAAAAVPEVQILHAATAVDVQTTDAQAADALTTDAPSTDALSSRAPETLVTTGGRVLSVVAVGTTFHEARVNAYEAIGKIHLEGAQFRSDIAIHADDSLAMQSERQHIR